MDEQEMKKCAEVFDEIRKELPSIVARAKAESLVKKRHETIRQCRRGNTPEPTGPWATQDDYI